MAKEYIYVTVADRYYCLQSSILNLSWILAFKHKKLHLESLGIKRRQIPAILVTLIKYRLFSQTRPEGMIRLPVFGHVCIRVHHGHKLFNLSELRTTKLFNPDVSAEHASNEIKAVTEAGSLNFAPTILDIEPENRWYTEAFIPGTRGKKNAISNPAQSFKNPIVGHLQKMILSRPANTKDLGDYVHDLQKKLTEQMLRSDLDSELHESVRKFVAMVVEKLSTSGDMTVLLTFTHGDFSFVNFVYAGDEVLVIDWEDAGERSLLHDLFNYFFTEIYYKRTQDPVNTDISDAIWLLLGYNELNQLTEIFTASDIQAVYRRLYFLERIVMLLGRDASEIRSRVLQRSIGIFTDNEMKAS